MAVPRGVEIPQKEKISEEASRSPGGVGPNDSEKIPEREHREVQRPDSENAARVKGAQVNGPGPGALAEQKFGDEIGAEKEEQAEPEASR